METIQLVPCLLCKHEGLCLSPSTHAKVLGGVHTCKLSTGEAETRRCLGLASQSHQVQVQGEILTLVAIW